MEPADIKARYRKIGLTGSELARRADIELSTLSRFIGGRTSPILRTLTRITDALAAAERERRDELIERHGLPDLPEGCDVVMIGGTPRRVVKPAITPREGKAA